MKPYDHCGFGTEYKISGLDEATVKEILKNCDLRAIRDDMITGLFGIKLPSLKRLSLISAEGEDRNLRIISASFPNLTHLEIYEAPITDNGIEFLTTLSNLEVLSLYECRELTEESHGTIGQLTKLRSLTLSSCPSALTKRDKGKGVQIQQTSLSVLRSELEDCSFSSLCSLKNLQKLDVGPFMAITPMAAACLLQMPSIRELTLHQCQLLDDEGLANICKMTSLVKLDLCKCQFVTSFFPITRLTGLKRLSLKRSSINNEDLAALTLLPRLKKLDIGECPKITDEGMRTFFTLSLPSKISLLEMADCRRLKEFNCSYAQREKDTVWKVVKIFVPIVSAGTIDQ